MRKDRLPQEYNIVVNPCRCGNPDIEIHKHGTSYPEAPWRLWCPKCQQSGTRSTTEKGAIENWNAVNEVKK